VHAVSEGKFLFTHLKADLSKVAFFAGIIIESIQWDHEWITVYVVAICCIQVGYWTVDLYHMLAAN